MGTFSETEIVDYCSSFADQGKQTSIFRFQQRNGSLPFPFPANKQMFAVSVSIDKQKSVSVFRLQQTD
jgi:hypothetical protein